MPLVVILVVVGVLLAAAALHDRRRRVVHVRDPRLTYDRNAAEAGHGMASHRTFQNFDGSFGG